MLPHRRHVLYAKAERVPVYVHCSVVAIAVGRSTAAAFAALTVYLLVRDTAEPACDIVWYIQCRMVHPVPLRKKAVESSRWIEMLPGGLFGECCTACLSAPLMLPQELRSKWSDSAKASAVRELSGRG